MAGTLEQALGQVEALAHTLEQVLGHQVGGYGQCTYFSASMGTSNDQCPDIAIYWADEAQRLCYKHAVQFLTTHPYEGNTEQDRPQYLAVDPTTVAANPAHYQQFSNGAQPAFICEHLSWNAGQAVRYLSRTDKKPEGDLTAEQVYLQNLKKAFWHIKREIMLVGGDPDDVQVPHPRPA